MSAYKKTKLKRIVSFLMVLILCLSFSSAAYAEDDNENSLLRYGEREVTTILKTEYATTTVTPNGQVPGGYRFETGGGLYVDTSGGPSVSVGFGVSWGTVSASVSVGIAGKDSSVGGLFLTAPNTTDYFIAKIDKTYKIVYLKIDYYKYTEYTGTAYVSKAYPYSENAYMVKV